MSRIAALIFAALLSLPSYADQVVARKSQLYEVKNTEIFTIESKVLGRKYDIYIKVPSGYFDDENRKTSYPVLYLNDAPHTFKVATGVTHFRSMNKAIVVGIDFAHGENGQFSRVRDLTPERDASWVKYTTGGAPDYLQFIQQELIPFVEDNYRADPARRILSGHSLGGSFGAWVLLTQPELFSSYILTSPSLWYKDDLIFDFEEEYAKQHQSLNANLFVATGSLETMENGMRNDMVDDHRRFLKRLRSRNYQGLNIQEEVVIGTDHESTFPVGLTKGLRWIYQDLW
ncbi:alpha/beta hydrolase [Microbulbifer elongatus]|uniref:alpha/beta hydrolase n=1 Tax=Microbulbifer elongatus TaxID=86173 RepID=UPI001CFC7968|nr:alpha/beta hydrolase-fold protein [Microbulbifer elongatus]